MKIIIRSNATCPAKDNVMDAVEKNMTQIKTVIGEEKVRGAYPLFVESERPENLYGFIKTMKDDSGNELDIDVMIPEVLANGYELVISEKSGANTMVGEIKMNEVRQANVSNAVSEKLQAIIDEKIAEGIVSKEEMAERLRVMQENKVDEALKIRVVRGYRKYNKAAHKPHCVYVDPYISKVKGQTEGIIAEGLRNSVSRMASICEGEKSVGKNVYMETIAWLLGMPLYMITFSRNMSPSSIYGEKSTDNSASEALKNMHDNAVAKVMLDAKMPMKNQAAAIHAAADFELQKARSAAVQIVIDQSELYDWMIDGGCMVLNELNMGESNFLSSFLNPLTDGTGFLFIPGRGEVKMHEDCVLFGTQNAECATCSATNLKR